MFSLFHRVRRSSVCRENCENFVKNGKLSCNWLIILVTMATPISSHGQILVFHQYLYNKKNLQLKPRANGRKIFGPMLHPFLHPAAFCYVWLGPELLRKVWNRSHVLATCKRTQLPTLLRVAASVCTSLYLKSLFSTLHEKKVCVVLSVSAHF